MSSSSNVWTCLNKSLLSLFFETIGLSEIICRLCRRQHLRRAAPDAETAAQRIVAIAAGWQTPLFRQPFGSGGPVSRIRVTGRWVRSSATGNGSVRLRSPTCRGRRSTPAATPVTRSVARYGIQSLFPYHGRVT